MMEKLDFNDEWFFIESEMHKEQPNENNISKRELLFVLQILLCDISKDFQKAIYFKSKEYYLKNNSTKNSNKNI